MSELENAMITIIEVFHKYSGARGDKCMLKKLDLKMLVNKELPHFIQEIKDPATLDKLFTDLDTNEDMEIDFQEYASLVAMVTSACHQTCIQK
ncbi:protein S100-B-like [Protopterus annectens]|uniref:protein S100-B-like n=1 Tax=Protopterus annectens TaxID=7888 RepID=UPI001CFB7AB6|nr:protein S100-B-like [Protopterus annectens]